MMRTTDAPAGAAYSCPLESTPVYGKELLGRRIELESSLIPKPVAPTRHPRPHGRILALRSCRRLGDLLSRLIIISCGPSNRAFLAHALAPCERRGYIRRPKCRHAL